jgi:hypothetical protein
LNADRGRHRKYAPYAFTQNGVAMLSSVLMRAVQVNLDHACVCADAAVVGCNSRYVDMFADGSRIHVFLGQHGRQLLYLHFDESDLASFLTNEASAEGIDSFTREAENETTSLNEIL